MIDLAICQPYLNGYGGAEKVILKIAKHFDAKIYCIDYEPNKTFEEFKNRDIELLKVKSNPFFIRKYTQNKLSLNRQMTWAYYAWTFYNAKLPEHDIISSHIVPSEWIRNKNTPVIWYNHGIMREVFDQAKTRRKQKGKIGGSIHWVYSELFFKNIEKKIIPKIEHIFTNSDFTAKQLNKYFNIKAETLYLGTEYDILKNKGYEKFFFYISRISEEKRPHLAIEAFRKFQKKHNDWKLIIAGGMRKGTAEEIYYNKLKKKAGKGVEIIPNIKEEQKIDLLSKCYTLIFPTLNEPFGIVPLEAMGSKKPVIIMKDAGGPLETVIDKKTGFIVGSVDEMAEKMNYLAEHPKINEQLGKQGYKHATKNFTWDNFLKIFEKRSKEVIKKHTEIR